MIAHKGIFNRNSLILSCSVGLVFLANFYQSTFSQPKVELTKEQTAFNFSTQSLKLIQFGHSRLTSSLLWMATLLESDIEHYKGSNNSWMYYRFRTIAELEPRFYLNYLVGGKYLSIIKDDVIGANELYALGLKQYPRDYWLSYHAGFNATFEMDDPDLGLEYYLNILGTEKLRRESPNIVSLINRLRVTREGIDLETAFKSVFEVYNTLDAGGMRSNMEDILYSIRAQIDLNCLNFEHDISKCRKNDFFGNPYIKTNGSWISRRPWREFKFKKRPRTEAGPDKE